MTETNIDRHIQLYLGVFAILLVLTLVTVLAAFVTHSIPIALGIAALKAGLVAAFFMHLRWERFSIHTMVFFTLFFFLAMVWLIAVSHNNVPEGTDFHLGQKAKSQTEESVSH